MGIKAILENYRLEELRMITLKLERELLKNSNDENKINNIDEEYRMLELKHKIIIESLYILTEREREIIKCLYIDGKTGCKTLWEVGIKVNMCKANIGKLRKRALEKLEKFLGGRL